MKKLKLLLQLFLTYFKIGLFTFGGGYAMIALIEDEIVKKKKWITGEELADIVTIAESTPGPVAINCSTYVGYKTAKFLGSIVATLAVVIPSFVIIFIISLFFDKFLSVRVVSYAFNGIKCAVGLIILRTGIKMLKTFEKKPLAVICLILSTVAVLVIDVLAVNVSTIYLILLGLVLGIMISVIDAIKSKNKKKNMEIPPFAKVETNEPQTVENTADGEVQTASGNTTFNEQTVNEQAISINTTFNEQSTNDEDGLTKAEKEDE